MGSLIKDLGIQNGHCGYCKREGDSSISYYLYAIQVDCGEYQAMIDQGWRRSGQLLYFPLFGRTCCNLTPIRLDCSMLNMTKSQRKCIKRLCHYLGISIPDNLSRIEIVSILDELEGFQWNLMPPTFSEESFQLYQTYQVEIHKEQRALVTRDGFQRFLCDSPLTNRPSNCTILGSPLKLGTFHIHYRIHGKLMAISVVDILPNCISSVYLIYDPEYSNLSWGTLSALLEIGLVRQITKDMHELRYYYLGYYLRDCPKLSYKACFQPSELYNRNLKRWVECGD